MTKVKLVFIVDDDIYDLMDIIERRDLLSLLKLTNLSVASKRGAAQSLFELTKIIDLGIQCIRIINSDYNVICLKQKINGVIKLGNTQALIYLLFLLSIKNDEYGLTYNDLKLLSTYSSETRASRDEAMMFGTDFKDINYTPSNLNHFNLLSSLESIVSSLYLSSDENTENEITLDFNCRFSNK